MAVPRLRLVGAWPTWLPLAADLLLALLGGTPGKSIDLDGLLLLYVVVVFRLAGRRRKCWATSSAWLLQTLAAVQAGRRSSMDLRGLLPHVCQLLVAGILQRSKDKPCFRFCYYLSRSVRFASLPGKLQ
jgi:hypothetical protein